jgi:hypothetical protein
MKHTQEGTWEVVNLTDVDTGEEFTPEGAGEYVKNSLLKNPSSRKFIAILCTKDDGPADVAHFGNGPTSEANAWRVLDCVRALAGIENPEAFVKAAFALVAELQDDNARGELDSCSKSALAKLAGFFPALK